MIRQQCINRELTTEVIVGAFMMTVLLGLGFFTIILSRESWFQQKQALNIVFEDVMGLREGDAVVCRGMPVGKVSELGIQEDGVRVQVTLDSPVAMHEDYRIEIVMTSILGGRNMSIDEGSEEARLLPHLPLYQGHPPHDIMADTADVVAVLKETLVEQGALDNLELAARELAKVAERINRGEGTVGKLLSDDDTLYEDMAGAIASIKEVAQRLEKGDSTIGKLLSDDDSLYADMAATASSLRQTVEKLSDGESTLGRLMADDAALYDDLAASLASLRQVAERLEKGQGLIGKLTTDEELYDDIKSTVNELKAGIEDIRETSPVTTFSSIFFGAL